MKKILMAMVVLLLAGCSVEIAQARKKKTAETAAEVDTVDIDGYSYYIYSRYREGYMAPTPDTIKRCMREVAEEKK